ncbi:hypothetical protein [Catenuloplanes atrovinosus]|uniref:ABC-type glycerol-3-phosphate transport system substrate-binding protein n=1 Tax=Catenuloplanes atrovinosus TaxID=137266 RepID=A0AAE3YLD7_9ACTN|nr:hypothetical protein [Catenuloplanes atrovinosus]MDR7274652.1 ABC-type glycerol-3-phosphate transport system substrate-binding protein [Catenuloplanes atrovinosus]
MDRTRIGRRSLLALGAGAAAAPLLTACAGASTTGAGGEGTVTLLSNQFSPVEERQRFEAILKARVTAAPVAFNQVETGSSRRRCRVRWIPASRRSAWSARSTATWRRTRAG